MAIDGAAQEGGIKTEAGVGQEGQPHTEKAAQPSPTEVCDVWLQKSVV